MTEQNTSLVAQVAAKPSIVLLDEGRFDDYLTKLREDALKVGTDVSTAKGRAAIKSKAFEIVKVRTSIEAEATRLKEDAQKTIRSVNAAQKPVTERLNELAKEIRAPLTRYEEEEAARVEACKANVQTLREAAVIQVGETAEAVAERLAKVQETEIIEADWPILFDAANQFKAQAIEALTAGHARLLQEEADQAELEALRQEKAARAEADRIAAEEAAEAERIAAEEKAEAERQEKEAAQKEAHRVAAVDLAMKHITDAGNGMLNGRTHAFGLLIYELETKLEHIDPDFYGADVAKIEAHRDATLAKLKADFEAQKAEAEAEAARLEKERIAEAAQRAKDEAAAAEKAAAEEAAAAQQRAHEEQMAAEKKRADDAEAARKRQEEEAEAEKIAAAAAAEKKRLEDEARAADVAHRTKIMSAAKVAIMGMGVGEQTAIGIVRAIAAGDVPAVSITF